MNTEEIKTINQHVSEIIAGLRQIIEDKGEETLDKALDLGLFVYQLDAASHLLLLILFLIIAPIVLLKTLQKLYSMNALAEKERRNFNATEIVICIVNTITSMVSFILFIIGINSMLDFGFFALIGVVHPEVWLAKQVLGL